MDTRLVIFVALSTLLVAAIYSSSLFVLFASNQFNRTNW